MLSLAAAARLTQPRPLRVKSAGAMPSRRWEQKNSPESKNAPQSRPKAPASLLLHHQGPNLCGPHPKDPTPPTPNPSAAGAAAAEAAGRSGINHGRPVSDDRVFYLLFFFFFGMSARNDLQMLFTAFWAQSKSRQDAPAWTGRKPSPPGDGRGVLAQDFPREIWDSSRG